MPLPVSHTEYFYSKLTNVFSEAYTAVLSLKSKRIYYAVLVNIWLTLPAPPPRTHTQTILQTYSHAQTNHANKKQFFKTGTPTIELCNAMFKMTTEKPL